jgi:hypothetical protein
MKRIKIFSMILMGGCLIAATSCKKYLDVNNNPNSPIDVTPDLILPAAVAQTAATNVTFNSYGAWAGGYQANAGGYGGFGSVLTYNYSTSDNTGLWSQSFNNLNDYQTIINKTDATGPYKNYNAIAKIMKAFCYLRLIDVYNDVPYSEALKGLGNLNPKYDKAEDVYRGLFKEINEAIASLALPNDPQVTIKTATSPNSQRIDIVYAGGEGDAANFTNFETSTGFPSARWTQFANTLKLKMLVRTREVPTFSATFNEEKAKLAGATFVTYDVKVQPGYAAQSGKQNPHWNSYAWDAAGNVQQLTTLPTFFAYGFYDGTKIEDDVRGYGNHAPVVTYKNYDDGNQLGVQNQFVPLSPNGTPWFTGSGSSTSGSGLGVLKGPTMSQPLMLAAESYFLQAEANLFGIVAGNDATNFNLGIQASERYLYTKQDESWDPVRVKGTGAGSDFDYYLNEGNNPNNYLVIYGLPKQPESVNPNDKYNTDAIQRKLEAIVTQKWIAVNYIHSNEGWSDYRRTGYPVTGAQFAPAGAHLEYYNFASTQSTSTRLDKLPVRVLYPQSEYALNPTNVPQGINAFTSRVFYDLN